MLGSKGTFLCQLVDTNLTCHNKQGRAIVCKYFFSGATELHGSDRAHHSYFALSSLCLPSLSVYRLSLSTVSPPIIICIQSEISHASPNTHTQTHALNHISTPTYMPTQTDASTDTHLHPDPHTNTHTRAHTYKHTHLGHHAGEQCVGCDVERHPEAHVAGALVHKAGQLASRHEELCMCVRARVCMCVCMYVYI